MEMKKNIGKQLQLQIISSLFFHSDVYSFTQSIRYGWKKSVFHSYFHNNITFYLGKLKHIITMENNKCKYSEIDENWEWN